MGVAMAVWTLGPPLLYVRDRWMWVYCVEGCSMSPTLNPQDTPLNRLFSDWVLVHKHAEIRKGDVVVLRDPATNQPIIKRLAAEQNDIVVHEGHHVFVSSGHCWVEGDNPDSSNDSRSFGPVPMGLVESLVVS